MQFFRYKEDRLPITIITLLFVADVYAYFKLSSLTALLVWLSFSILTKIFIACWNHHHQHVHTFRQNFLNRLLEIVYTFHTGITTNVWVLHHNLGHHVNYLDQTKDESGWKRKDGSTMGPLEYTLVIGISGYYRALQVGKRYPKFKKDLLGMGMVNLLLLTILFYYNPLNAFFVFLLPMLTIYFGTCWFTYYHHAGLNSDDHFYASHNITNKYYNLLSGNLGYHTAHHLKQGLHWSKLPQLHREIEHKIPPELLDPRFPVLGRLLRHQQRYRTPQI